MHSKEVIEITIREAVKDITGITALSKDSSFVDRELNIIPADFLYIFNLLEKKLQLPVHDIFINHTYEVMTVENLTDALYELEKRGHIEEMPC